MPKAKIHLEHQLSCTGYLQLIPMHAYWSGSLPDTEMPVPYMILNILNTIPKMFPKCSVIVQFPFLSPVTEGAMHFSQLTLLKKYYQYTNTEICRNITIYSPWVPLKSHSSTEILKTCSFSHPYGDRYGQTVLQNL